MAKKYKKVGRPKAEDREVDDDSSPPKKSSKKDEPHSEPKKRGRKSKFDMKPEPPPPRKPCNIDFSKGYTIPLKGLQSAITCGLCKGFLVDASTIVECLHTFCKSCLLKWFEEETRCPTCDDVVHQSHPTSYISHDRTLQDIIYKLVPGLYDNEVKEREATSRKQKIENGEDLEAEERIKAEKLAELEADRTNRCYEGRAKYSHHRDEPQMGNKLFYGKKGFQMVIELFPGVSDLPTPPKRFVRTGEMCTVTTLKRYLSYAMYGTKSRHHELDLYFKNELMGRDFSMKFIQVTRCKNKPPDMPLRLNYRHRKEQL